MTKIGIFCALGGVTNSPETFQIPPRLVTHPEAFKHREDYFAKIQQHIDDGVQSVLIHRMYGEPVRGDAMDADSRWALDHSTNTQLRDYSQHMTKLKVDTAIRNPHVRFDDYIGSFRCISMENLLRLGMGHEWAQRFNYQIEPIQWILDGGGDARFVFDHAASYKDHERYADIISQLSRRYPGRVVAEAIPLEGSPLLGMHAIAKETRYDFTRAKHHAALNQAASVTRWVDGSVDGDSDNDAITVLKDCLANGHDFYVSEAVMNRQNISVRDMADVADAGRPQGAD